MRCWAGRRVWEHGAEGGGKKVPFHALVQIQKALGHIHSQGFVAVFVPVLVAAGGDEL